jgi:hypothetical protein
MKDTDVNDSLTFVTLGMFIIDEFSFLDEQDRPTGRSFAPQESWLGCRILFTGLTIYSTADRGWDLYRDRSSYLVVMAVRFISSAVINLCA